MDLDAGAVLVDEKLGIDATANPLVTLVNSNQ